MPTLTPAALLDSIRPPVIARAKDPLPSVLAMLPRLHESLVQCWRQANLAAAVDRLARQQTPESLKILWRNFDPVVVRHLGASLEDTFDGLLSFRMPTHAPRWIVAEPIEVCRRGLGVS